MRYTIVYEKYEWWLIDHDKRQKAAFGAFRDMAEANKELLETNSPEACKCYERLMWQPHY